MLLATNTNNIIFECSQEEDNMSSTINHNNYNYNNTANSNTQNNPPTQVPPIQSLSNPQNSIKPLNTSSEPPQSQEQMLLPSDIYVSTNNIDDTPLTYREIINYFTSLYLSKSKEANVHIQTTNNNKKCCLLMLFNKIRKNVSLDSELIKEKSILLFISNIHLDIQNQKHFNIIKTLYYITHHNDDNNNNKEDIVNDTVVRYYEHIKRVCEDNKNSRDYMKLSCFDVMEIIALSAKHPSFIEENKKDNEKEYNEMYFDVLVKHLVSFSNVTVMMLKQKVLDLYCIKNKSVINTVNEFYFGIIQINIEEMNNKDWKKANVLNDIIDKARNHPSSILWKYNLFKEKYPEIKDSISQSFHRFENDFSQ